MRWELSPAEIHLWSLRPAEIVDPKLLLRYTTLLDDSEHSRWQRFVFPQHRHDFLCSRALVRCVLSHYIPDVAPQTWRFVAGAHGKPAILAPQSELISTLRFNLSHTQGMALLAVTQHWDIGVDVEYIHRRGRITEIADRFFAPTEVQALQALPQAEQRERFFVYWTLKEAYIKATGRGLATPLDQFAFDVSTMPPRIAFDSRLPDNPNDWQFVCLPLVDGFQRSLAVRRGECPDLQIKFRQEMAAEQFY